MLAKKMWFFSLIFTIASCSENPEKAKEQAIEEIQNTEKEFATMVEEKGMKAAFLYYADEEAVIHRNNQLIKGRSAIEEYMSAEDYSKIRLEWSPDFVEVSASCDLGYTWGRYTYSYPDSLGKEVHLKGVFHTVWKKQADGGWKYVWD